MQFYFSPGDEADESGHFYALAHCTGQYGKQTAEIGIYFCPIEGYSRYSLHAFASNGHRLVYASGPDYSNAAEAMLLDYSTPLNGIPAYAWSLVPIAPADVFALPGHEEQYWKARRELARALYPLRFKSHPYGGMVCNPFFSAVGDKWASPDPYAATAENQEVLSSMMQAMDDD